MRSATRDDHTQLVPTRIQWAELGFNKPSSAARSPLRRMRIVYQSLAMLAPRAGSIMIHGYLQASHHIPQALRDLRAPD